MKIHKPRTDFLYNIIIIFCHYSKGRSYSPEAAPVPMKQYTEPETVIFNPYRAPPGFLACVDFDIEAYIS